MDNVGTSGYIAFETDDETIVRYNFESAEKLYAEGNFKKAFEIHMINTKQQSFAPSQTCIGNAYENGDGVQINIHEAIEWYKLAANQGDIIALSNLGLLYGSGDKIPQDANEAIKYWKLAADKGHIESIANLGVMFDGIGNKHEAFNYYKIAAEKGHPGAQFNLGVSYYCGEGVSKDDKEALNWIKKAANQGYEPAINMLIP